MREGLKLWKGKVPTARRNFMGVWSRFKSSFVTRPMLMRSLVTSGVVGGLLFTVNHEWRVLLDPWPAAFWRQLGISMIIPFIVSLTSAILTRREMLAAVRPITN